MASSKVRGCYNIPYYLCYVCRKFAPKAQHKTISSLIKNAYTFYFGCALSDKKKVGPHTHTHIRCVSCAVTLAERAKGKRRSLPLAVPIWREPEDH